MGPKIVGCLPHRLLIRMQQRIMVMQTCGRNAQMNIRSSDHWPSPPSPLSAQTSRAHLRPCGALPPLPRQSPPRTASPRPDASAPSLSAQHGCPGGRCQWQYSHWPLPACCRHPWHPPLTAFGLCWSRLSMPFHLAFLLHKHSVVKGM